MKPSLKLRVLVAIVSSLFISVPLTGQAWVSPDIDSFVCASGGVSYTLSLRIGSTEERRWSYQGGRIYVDSADAMIMLLNNVSENGYFGKLTVEFNGTKKSIENPNIYNLPLTGVSYSPLDFRFELWRDPNDWAPKKMIKDAKTENLSVTVDTAGPETITISGGTGSDSWAIDDCAISVAASDGLSGIASLSPTIASFSEEGNHSFTVTAIDHVGNKSTQTGYANIDKTPPTVSLAGPEISNADAVTLTIKAEDSLSKLKSGFPQYRYSLNGAPATAWVSGSSFVVSDEGRYVIEARAMDNVGREAYASKTLTIDRTKPVVTLSSTNPGWSNVNVTVSADATDAFCAANLLIYEYKSPTGNWIAGKSTEIQVAGSTVVTFRASDLAGNVSAEKELAVRIDRTNPIISCCAEPIGWSNNFVTLYPKGEDDGLELDNSSSYQYSEPVIRNRVSAEGERNVEVWVFDKAGNKSNIVAVPVKIDTTKPEIPVFSSYSIVFSDTDSRIATVNFDSFELRDPGSARSGFAKESIMYSIASESGKNNVGKSGLPSEAGFKNGAYPKYDKLSNFNILFLKSDVYIVTLHVKDQAGNEESTSSPSIAIDLTPPSFTLAGSKFATLRNPALSATQYQLSILIEKISELVGADTKQSGVSFVTGWFFKLDGADAFTQDSVEYSDASFTYSYSLPETIIAGEHTLSVKCKDTVGNESALVSIKFMVDKMPPEIKFSEPQLLSAAESFDSWKNVIELGYAVTDSNLKTVEYSITKKTVDGYSDSFSTVPEGTFPFQPLKLPSSANVNNNGKFKITIKASDKAGNTGTRIGYINIDRTPPGILVPEGFAVSITATSPEFEDALEGHSPIDWNSCRWRFKDSAAWTGGATISSATLQGKDMQVEFEVRDMAGNQGRKLFFISLDGTGPVIKYDIDPFTSIKKKKILKLSITDLADAGVGMASGRVDYSIDGSAYSVLSGFNASNQPGEAMIDLAHFNLSEGKHYVSLRGLDSLENTGPEEKLEFFMDNEAPKIESIKITQTGKTLGEQDFASAANFTASIEATDLNLMNSPESPGKIVAYRGACDKSKEPTEILKAAALPGTSPIFDVVSKGSGINYLHIWVQDAAGNETYTQRVVMVDDSKPGIPTVSSPTHKPAIVIEDASIHGDASFAIKSTSMSAAGIASYPWVLSTVLNSIATKVSSGNADGGPESELLLRGLPDNERDCFYSLSVTALGNNGKESVPRDYTFRIDSRPPTGLRLYSTPQADSTAQYNEPTTKVYWMQPADMTGVKTYYYKAMKAESWVDWLDGEPIDATWTPLTAKEVELNLKQSMAPALSGSVIVGVLAEDWSGNRMFAKKTMQCDFIKPLLEELPDGQDSKKSIRISKPEDKARLVEWGMPSDADSGIAYLALRLSSLRAGVPERTIVLACENGEIPRNYLFENLVDDSTYTLMVRISDRAGNTSDYYHAFSMDGTAPPDKISYPYSASFGGISVAGDRVALGDEISYENITLNFQEGYPVILVAMDSEGLETRTPVRSLAAGGDPGDIAWDEAGIVSFRTSAAAGEIYEIKADGFVIRARQISFTATLGLSCENALYHRYYRRNDGEGAAQAVSMGTARIGFPHQLGIRAASVASIESFLAAIKTALPPPFDFTNAYSVSGASAMELAAKREQLYGTPEKPLAFDSSYFDRNGFKIRAAIGSDESERHAIRLESVAVLPGGSEAEGRIESTPHNPVSLTMQSTKYLLVNAELRGKNLIVNEATFALPAGYEPSTATVRNFTLDGASGIVSEGRFFSCSPIKTTGPGGEIVSFASIRLNEVGQLMASGTVKPIGTTELSVYGVLINSNGADWLLGGTITDFLGFVHGFQIESSDAKFMQKGLLLTSAALTYRGKTLSIANLGLRTEKASVTGGADDYNVWQTGSGTETISVVGGYGEYFLTDFSVEVAGFFSSALVPATRDTFLDVSTEGKLKFTHTRLFSDNSVRGAMAETRIALGGYITRARNLVFDAAAIMVEAMSINAPSGFTPATFDLYGAEFKASGIMIPPEAPISASYAFDSWLVALERITLDSSGLGGSGMLMLPESLGSYAVGYPSFRVTSAGVVLSGKATVDATARVHGWDVGIERSELTDVGGAYLLWSPVAVVSLAPMNPGSLVFKDLKLAADGTVVSCEAGSAPIAFTSTNGYKINTGDYNIGSGFIELGGTILPYWWPMNSGIRYGSGGLRLLSDGSVVSCSTADQAAYEFSGWKISGSTVSFCHDRITLGANSVRYLNKTVELGELIFSTDGILLGDARRQDTQSLDLYGGQFIFIESRFDENGLAVKAFVSLDSRLGGYSLVFDEVRLFQDGSFSVASSIPRFSFDLGGFTFEFEDVWLSGGGLKLGSAAITLPETLESKQIRLYGLTVTSTGQFQLAGSSVDPIKLWDMWFGIDNLSIAGDVVSLEGFIGLPDTESLGPLAGRKVAIDKFEISTSGTVKTFDAALAGEYTIPLADAWALKADTFGFKYEDGSPWLMLKNGAIVFPPEFPVSEAYISEVAYNLETRKFNFEDLGAKLENCGLEKWGMTFSLSRIDFMTEASDRSKITKCGFTGNVKFPADTENIPEFLSGKNLSINKFEIGFNGKLGEINVSLTGLHGKLSNEIDLFELKDGSLQFNKEGESVVIAIGGSLVFTENAPGTLPGKYLSLGNPAKGNLPAVQGFVFDFERKKILALSAGASDITMEMGNVSLEKLGFSVSWNPSTQAGTMGIKGYLRLPATLPEGLAGSLAGIDDFSIQTDGTIKSFQASYASPTGAAFKAIGKIQLCDVKLSVSSDNLSERNPRMLFSAGTKILLPEGDFPKGIGGTSGTAAMTFSAANGIETVSAIIELAPEIVLFDTLALRSGKIGFAKGAGPTVVITAAGTLVLPSSFPQGLAGLPVGGSIVFDTNGVISALDIKTSGINLDVFEGCAKITNGSLGTAKGPGQDELVFTVSGGIQLVSAGLPQSVRDATFVIDPLVVSTTRGLLDFSAGIQAGKPIEFPLVSGIIAGITTLRLSKSDVSVSAYITLPESYPTPLGGMQLVLETLTMDWNGKIKALSGGIGAAKISLLGFDASISKLYINPEGAGLESCIITLPANFGSMGGKTVGMKNAVFEKTSGEFSAEFVIPALTADFMGFTVVLDQPSLDIPNKKISFVSASLKMPDFTGGAKIALNGVSLSPSGFAVSGGAFTIPDFKIEGGLGFSNLRADFALYNPPNADGERYSILGGGCMTIPGAGIFSAEISFSNKSVTYPIGLKRAYFSYYAGNAGLALPGTGLSLNGIRGGIAFGKPQPGEMPPALESFFDKGTRLQLGLRFLDTATIGNVLLADADVWIDVMDWDWAFSAKMTVLKGTFNLSANVIAALTKQGFYANMGVKLVFVEGNLELWVFCPDGSETKFAGSGLLQFGLVPGAIYKTKILGKQINIPAEYCLLPGIHAEFGDFTDGRQGFKAFINVPFFNSVGVFASNSGLSLDIQGLTLMKPSAASSSSTVSRDIGRGAKFSEPGIRIDDKRFITPMTTAAYGFSVPGQGVSKQKSTNSKKNRGAFSPIDETPEYGNVSAYERIIFIVAFTEGDPAVCVVSPSGLVYRPGDPGLESQYAENAIMFAVSSMEVGAWEVLVDGVAEDSYEISALVKATVPSLTLEEPAYDDMRASDDIFVMGSVDRDRGIVKVYASAEDKLSGMEIGRLAVGANGAFSGRIPAGSLPDGRYKIYTSFDQPDALAESRRYAPGSIMLDRSSIALTAPESLLAAETQPGTVTLSWIDENGLAARGFRLLYANAARGTVESLYLGNIRSVVFPNFAPGDDVTFSIVAVDSLNRQSHPSGQVRIVMGGPKPGVNSPRVFMREIPVIAEINGLTTGILAVGIDDFSPTEDASRIITASAAWPSEKGALGDITAQFPFQTRAEAKGISLEWKIALSDTVAPGRYELPGTIRNMANGALSCDITFVVDAVYPVVTLDTALPREWNSKAEQRLSVFGRGFLPGTRVFLGDDELALEEKGLSYTTITAIVPAGAKSGARTLTVRGPGGSEAKLSVRVSSPDWMGMLKTALVEAQAGTSARYHIRVDGIEGFEDLARFVPVSLPEGWSCEFDSIAAGHTGVLSLAIPSGASLGMYETIVEGSGKKRFTLRTKVVKEAPTPSISSLSQSAGFPGSTVTAYGYGFGQDSVVTLAALECERVTQDDSEITFIIPDAAVSGDILITRSGIASNSASFMLRTRGFSIHPEISNIELQPGERRLVSLALAGYSDAVSLKATSGDSMGISGVLSCASITPNATLSCEITASSLAAMGSYPLTISGISRGFSSSAIITVTVINAFALESAALAKGMLDSIYRERLGAVNGIGRISYEISQGALPDGLRLLPEGIIDGKPSEVGNKIFTIKARDGRRRESEREYSILIEESAWAQLGRDGGRSRYADSASPADARSAWTAKVPGKATALITGSGKAWVSYESSTGDAASGIAAYSRQGALAYIIPGKVFWCAYAGGKLYTIQDGYGLRALDPDTGNVIWSREAVSSAACDGSVILARSDKGGIALNASDGSLVEENIPVPEDLGKTLWREGRCYSWSKKIISATQGPDRYASRSEIIAVCADAYGFALMDARGELVLLDSNLVPQKRLRAYSEEYLITEPSLSLTESSVLVSDETGTREFSRLTLKESWFAPVRGLLATAREKAFVAGDLGVRAINRYSGAAIWNDVGSFTDIALAGDRLYATDNKFTLRCYDAPDNVAPPNTRLNTVPPAPDGLSGWFKTIPAFSVESRDIDGYVQTIMEQSGEGDWGPYASPRPLGEGCCTIQAYGIDQNGWRGETAMKAYKVDVTLPETQCSIEGTIRETGWYGGPVVLTLKGNDELSGLSHIQIEGRADYSVQMLLGDGSHTLRYRAVDNAGNEENWHAITILVDGQLPVAGTQIRTEHGIALVRIDAADAHSDIDRIEYQVGGGMVLAYDKPLIFIQPGMHELRYRAIDKAGNACEWQQAQVFVREWGYHAGYAAFVSLNGRDSAAQRPVKPGMRLYGDGFGGISRKVKNLPRYMIGGDAILSKSGDRGNPNTPYAVFYVKRDSIVYVFAAPGGEDAGWTLAGTRIDVNHDFFPDGAALYSRRFKAGEQACIPGIFALNSAPLIIAVPIPIVDVNILLSAGHEGFGAGAILKLQAEIRADNPESLKDLRREWSVRNHGPDNGVDDESAWQAQTNEEYLLPWTAESIRLDVRLQLFAADGYRVAEGYETIIVTNKTLFSLFFPKDGLSVDAGGSEFLSYEARGSDGNQVSVQRLCMSRDGKTWSEAELRWGALWTVPQVEGPLWLKIIYEESPGRSRETIIKLNVRKSGG